ncbi:MAG: 2-phosphosulfolactate phosphatase [Planctomycetia bacterium]|jgi:2-phosphosulfolactate phosphatase|nr:2-phosphosulfolactate phosphatase [Planctomycetia bacterium]
MHWLCHDRFHRMPPGATAGGIAVVIDVLRASTTIVTALAHGAALVLPRRSLEEARAAAAARPGAVLGGERGGVRIEGFELGNSPAEYTADRVAGRPVVITTTNGTAALAACHEAVEVLVGAIVNRTAVTATARRLAAERGCDAIHLVCAGTDGHVTGEDVLAAGAILDAAGGDAQLDEAAAAARERFRALAAAGRGGLEGRIATAFRTCLGGENLIALGMESDLPLAAAIDSLALVPRLDRRVGALVAAS